jgi:hypothetical protein
LAPCGVFRQFLNHVTVTVTVMQHIPTVEQCEAIALPDLDRKQRLMALESSVQRLARCRTPHSSLLNAVAPTSNVLDHPSIGATRQYRARDSSTDCSPGSSAGVPTHALYRAFHSPSFASCDSCCRSNARRPLQVNAQTAERLKLYRKQTCPD